MDCSTQPQPVQIPLSLLQPQPQETSFRGGNSTDGRLGSQPDELEDELKLLQEEEQEQDEPLEEELLQDDEPLEDEESLEDCPL
jgi:hypothetical protein